MVVRDLRLAQMWVVQVVRKNSPLPLHQVPKAVGVSQTPLQSDGRQRVDPPPPYR
jgi:hypothetical protein